MRQKLKDILGEELLFLALGTREHLGVTQKKMRERLYMGESSCSDIEISRNHCGRSIATMLLNPQKILGLFRQRIAGKTAAWNGREVQSA